MAGLDQAIAHRIRQSVERIAEIGAGNIKRLQGIDPPEFRVRVGDYRVLFHNEGDRMRVLRMRNRRELTADIDCPELKPTAPLTDPLI